MIYKEEKLRQEWDEIHPKLRLILCDAEIFLKIRQQDLIITCLLRTPEEQLKLFEAEEAISKTSVHCFGRGADVRLTDNGIVNAELIEYINGKYTYDSNRPKMNTLLQHEGTAEHFHFQVMDNFIL